MNDVIFGHEISRQADKERMGEEVEKALRCATK